MKTTPLLKICKTIVQWLNQSEPQNPSWSPPTWETFQRVCRIHGIAPLLHEKLKGVDWKDDTVQSWLTQQYAFNTQRIAKIHKELKAILARFSENSVRVMPLKGSILSTNFYQDPARRPMADIDLLIQLEDFEAGADLLARLGYERDVAHWKHTEFSKPDNRQVVSRTSEHPENPRKVEIHLQCRETFGGPTVNLTELMWANSMPGELLGESVTIPNPDALWLHLLVHSTYHIWQGKGRLIQLVDLAQLTPQLHDPLPLLNSIDARFTYPSLVLLKKLFPAVIEDSLLAAQGERVSPTFKHWVASLDLVNTSYLNPKPPGPYLLKALKFTGGRPQEVIQALRFAFWPSLEEIALDHPKLAKSKAPWLAYFLLPLDWTKRLVTGRKP